MNSWNLLSEIRRRVAEESGVLRKAAPVRVALCHPSTYRVAMSSLGFQSIYREINLHTDACAERAFVPDDPDQYRRNRMPVLTYESETPLSHFPVIAFSIAYELELPGIFEILDLCGIPSLRRERTEQHPLIIAGGPLTNSNPVILAPFADLIFVGEGENFVHTLLEEFPGAKRDDLLSRLSAIPGVYVPGVTAEMPQAARAADFSLPAYSQILTANTVLASMFLIEPERGCSRSCTYCVMRRTDRHGMRLVPPEKVLSLIPEEARRVGLVGAAVTDHLQIERLVSEIVAGGREIGVSSLRADRLTGNLVRALAQGGNRTLTTASDGASQRLRNQVDRRTSERHLIRAAEFVRDTGMHRLKLYEMVGLPGETQEDIDELVRFSLELSRIAPVSLGISPFVAKRNTPLDGALFEPISSINAKLARIRLGVKGMVEVRPASARWAWVEYMLSQCGEAAGLAALDAWKAGGGFTEWKRAFNKREIKPECGGKAHL